MGTGRGSATTWSGGDALGSVRQTLDDAGGVLAATGYDPWGTPQQPLPTPFGFTGELHPQDHVYLRARWYVPGQGTFPSRDPFAGFAEMPYSLHAYQYGYSNPVRWTDPSGENPLACLVPAVADGTLPAGEVVSVVCLVGYGVYAGAVALAGAVAIDTAATTLSDITTPQRTPPLDPGPPEQSVSAGPHVRSPSIEDYTVRNPLTGPEEACWVLPGPTLGAQPWPFTTGAPGEQVSGPLVWTISNSPSELFPNLQPEDQPESLDRVYPTDIRSVRTSDRYMYVVTEDGELIMGSASAGHIDLAGGMPVRAAGEVKVWRGKIAEVNNLSGHYQPHGLRAQEAAVNAFQKAGFDAIPYKEYIFP